MRCLTILLACLLLQPHPPILVSAHFNSSTTAIVQWEQPPGIRITCLRIYHAGATWPAGICWDNLPEGPMRVELPGELTDPAYRPEFGDRLILAFGMDDVGHATLGESVIHRLYLPMTMQSAAPLERRVYLAAWRN